MTDLRRYFPGETGKELELSVTAVISLPAGEGRIEKCEAGEIRFRGHARILAFNKDVEVSVRVLDGERCELGLNGDLILASYRESGDALELLIPEGFLKGAIEVRRSPRGTRISARLSNGIQLGLSVE